ncbi:serine hydrolase domain-containing protein [Geodermatophilus sp. URMC 61]|uniref:serine hydrolase domain-containing protein n=1 Tax=Geodermatophilus sp. URMC 61 TaxID=3423411 RepID=UPI00406BECC8
MTATLLLVPVAAVAAGWLAVRLLRRRRRLLRVSVAVLTVLVVLLGGLQLWALTALDRSAAARAIVWREADVDDVSRFPARVIEAGPTTLTLSEGGLPGGTLDQVTDRDGRERRLEQLVEESTTEALVVLHGDEVVYERYANGGAADRPHTSFSVAKSFLSTLVGIAIDRGEIESLDDPVTDHVPELLDRDERFADVTLRHLVTMSSGLAYEEQGLPWSHDATTYYAPDLRAEALSAEVAGEPGRTWNYNNFNPLLMGLVLERATGTSVSEYMERHLWQPMGADADGSWSLDSEDSGFEKLESGVNAVARDYARFGLLVAHEGRVGDRQVVSAEWVREATARDTSRDPADHYQYWWWVDTERPGRFFARGNFGQYVYVDPATDVVVVRLGRDDGGEYWVELLRDVADRVAAAA